MLLTHLPDPSRPPACNHRPQSSRQGRPSPGASRTSPRSHSGQSVDPAPGPGVPLRGGLQRFCAGAGAPRLGRPRAARAVSAAALAAAAAAHRKPVKCGHNLEGGTRSASSRARTPAAEELLRSGLEGREVVILLQEHLGVRGAGRGLGLGEKGESSLPSRCEASSTPRHSPPQRPLRGPEPGRGRGAGAAGATAGARTGLPRPPRGTDGRTRGVARGSRRAQHQAEQPARPDTRVPERQRRQHGRAARSPTPPGRPRANPQ